ncbi:MAG: hypothetical protein IJQ79_08125 [Bacteroidales bacterium]|nr:hypothetical protein [Bacteroidales bacterium]
MAAKKKYDFTIHVEDQGLYDVYFHIKADTVAEAKEKARKRFIRENWNRRHLKAYTVEKSYNV